MPVQTLCELGSAADAKSSPKLTKKYIMNEKKIHVSFFPDYWQMSHAITNQEMSGYPWPWFFLEWSWTFGPKGEKKLFFTY